jgi:GT2 family glycosyltransferase
LNTPVQLTVVIPSKGLNGLLRICLEHLQRALLEVFPDHYRIIVIDNASVFPYSATDFDGILPGIIRFDTPHSYAAACNFGAQSAPADYFLFLNNDVILHNRSLSGMVRLFSDEKIGISGTRLVFPDGTIQHCGVLFGPDDRGPYHMNRRQPSRIIPRRIRYLQAVTGACMLIRQECFHALQGFSDIYPFGLEDIDLCLRARQNGWGVICDQSCDSLHFESMTEGRIGLDVPSRKLFMEQWKNLYTIDGER